jgi:hypothetical protein
LVAALNLHAKILPSCKKCTKRESDK